MKKEVSVSLTVPRKPPILIRILSDPAYASWIGLFIRLFLAWFLPWLLDGGRLLQGVSYTDIDFLVFTDAAEYIKRGLSPYDRHTYRYTPFLAELLSRFPHKEYGRYLFCIADAFCGYIILHERRARRRKPQQQQQKEEKIKWFSVELVDAMWWLYNPLAINICTRGSSESLMVLLPVLLTFWIATSQERQQQQQPHTTDEDNNNDGTATYLQVLLAGICHGVAVHSKLYPIIYSLSYMAYFATSPRTTTPTTKKTGTFPWTQPYKLFRLVKLWIGRLLFSSKPLLFLVTFISTFGLLTWLAVYIYGEIALQEGLLYHFSRVDHRHNYSMYWYWIYLARGRTADAAATMMSSSATATATIETASSLFSLATLGRLLLVPQVLLLAYSSLGMAPHGGQLGLTLFVQTYLFVTHNKVITAQYFTWYLCLLPLCNSGGGGGLLSSRKIVKALILLIISILLWLGSAYGLEMQGLAFHRIVWLASVLYFFANVNLMGSLLQQFVGSKRISNNDSDISNKTTPTRAGDDSKKKN
jgi:phosphatidylinositol glycan class M